MKRTILISVLVGIVGLTVAFFIARYAVTSVIRGDSLFVAVQKQNHAEIRLLLASGADPNFLFDGSIPPLQVAIDHRDVEAIALLLCAGASVDKLDDHYRSQLLKKALSDKVRVLVKVGCKKDL